MAVMIFGLCGNGNGAYPIPVDCRNEYHAPTIAGAPIIQAFGHFEHVGIDYKVEVGKSVFVVMDGIVMYTAQDSKVYGRHVFVLHCDGYASLYGHLSRIDVKFGQIVTAGQLIGLSGGDPKDSIDGDGWSDSAHLHFEIRMPGYLESNSDNLDPALYAEMTKQYKSPVPHWGWSQSRED